MRTPFSGVQSYPSKVTFRIVPITGSTYWQTWNTHDYPTSLLAVNVPASTDRTTVDKMPRLLARRASKIYPMTTWMQSMCLKTVIRPLASPSRYHLGLSIEKLRLVTFRWNDSLENIGIFIWSVGWLSKWLLLCFIIFILFMTDDSIMSEGKLHDMSVGTKLILKLSHLDAIKKIYY